MSNWLESLITIMAQPSAGDAILISVAQVEGSGPREPSAKMVVTSLAQFDTIGGGHLEHRAIEIAREMLEMRPQENAASIAAQRRLQRFPLGPALGQCCGGVVHLVFDRIDAQAADYFTYLQARLRNGQDSWRMLSLDSLAVPTICDHDGVRLHGPGKLPTLPLLSIINGAMVLQDADGGRWLVDSCLAPRPQLFLFGVGHVGAAIVKALADLPCRVVWVDEREELFPVLQPANVLIEATDVPEMLVKTAPAGSSFLVMTHNHALDQRLSELILKRDDVAWFGLIGSKSKRMQFEHRLHERGVSEERLATMVCPIGVPGIIGKQPAVIAASVTAQLLQVWEQIASAALLAKKAEKKAECIVTQDVIEEQ